MKQTREEILNKLKAVVINPPSHYKINCDEEVIQKYVPSQLKRLQRNLPFHTDFTTLEELSTAVTYLTAIEDLLFPNLLNKSVLYLKNNLAPHESHNNWMMVIHS